MGTIFNIAMRNIFRHKKRSLLTGVIIVYTGMDRALGLHKRSF